MHKIAVDVVLIPPDHVIRLAVDINKSFPETSDKNYVLDPKTCVPHVTLCMGLVEREQLGEIGTRLSALTNTVSSLNLTITHVETSAISSGEIMSGLAIKKTPELQRLHEMVLDEMNPLFTYDGVETTMFYTPPPIREVPMFWGLGLAKTSVRERYSPHITLGIGVPKQEITPISFTASRLALCHLGNYCTCRDTLWSASFL